MHFTYTAVGLPDMQADDYLERDSPLASALSALMRVSQQGKSVQKYQSLQKIAGSGLDEARKALLANIVETYLKLTATEKTDFEQMIARPEAEEIREMISVYEERGIEKGIVAGQRRVLLHLLTTKFGKLPKKIRQQVEAIESSEALDALSERILTATSLEDMKLEVQ